MEAYGKRRVDLKLARALSSGLRSDGRKFIESLGKGPDGHLEFIIRGLKIPEGPRSLRINGGRSSDGTARGWAGVGGRRRGGGLKIREKSRM